MRYKFDSKEIIDSIINQNIRKEDGNINVNVFWNIATKPEDISVEIEVLKDNE